MDTRIYVMTHKEYIEPEDKLYVSLHVGAEGKEELGYLKDNSGDNISSMNKHYCELTGVYWLWKNVECDIVGVCHYRRFFMKDNRLLTKEYIEERLSKYDILLPLAGVTDSDNIYEHYKAQHIISDWDVCGEVISECCPEYVQAYELVSSRNVMYHGNMIITKKDIFNEYCEWLFNILFQVQERIDYVNRDSYQQRVFGFLSERLLSVWLMNHEYKIAVEDMQMIDTADLSLPDTICDSVKKITRVMFGNLVTMYKQGYRPDATRLSSEVGADGKIPYWVCWWQGYDNMPDISIRCLESLLDNIDQDKYQVYFISLDNVSEYVRFSDKIVRYVNEGKISFTLLSDILRVQLLYRYGGVWMDLTYYVADGRINDFLDRDFVTIVKGDSSWLSDVVKGRWSGNFMKAEAGLMLYGFMMDCFELYFELRDDLIHYFLIDYIIDLAYESFPEVKSMIDNCPMSNPKAVMSAEEWNILYRADRWKEISRDTYLFKLYNKVEYRYRNIVGEETLIGHVLRLS